MPDQKGTTLNETTSSSSTAPADVVRRQYLASAARRPGGPAGHLGPRRGVDRDGRLPPRRHLPHPRRRHLAVMEQLGQDWDAGPPTTTPTSSTARTSSSSPATPPQQGHRQGHRRPRRPPLHRPRRPHRALRTVRRHRQGPRRDADLASRRDTGADASQRQQTACVQGQTRWERQSRRSQNCRFHVRHKAERRVPKGAAICELHSRTRRCRVRRLYCRKRGSGRHVRGG